VRGPPGPIRPLPEAALRGSEAPRVGRCPARGRDPRATARSRSPLDQPQDVGAGIMSFQHEAGGVDEPGDRRLSVAAGAALKLLALALRRPVGPRALTETDELTVPRYDDGVGVGVGNTLGPSANQSLH
jgi:hypothetical protein